MHDFRRLDVWTRARAVVGEIYRLTSDFPSRERFGLTSQVRRAAVSIAANIAEGAGRSGDRDFARLLDVACGSASEVETLLVIAGDLGFAAPDETEPVVAEVRRIQRMLGALARRARANAASGPV